MVPFGKQQEILRDLDFTLVLSSTAGWRTQPPLCPHCDRDTLSCGVRQEVMIWATSAIRVQPFCGLRCFWIDLWDYVWSGSSVTGAAGWVQNMEGLDDLWI
jgi:hypothetical protein